MINFLLCFDENYNNVALLFLHTLLKNVSEKINIYIIHQNPKSLNEIKEKLLKYENINELNIYKFKEDLSKFPNILHGHMSEATYYRIYIDNYLPENIEYIFYVDADLLCNKNPIPALKKEVEKLKNSKFMITAKTEVSRTKNPNWDHWEKLELNSTRYFNAGVKLIKLQEWKKANMSTLMEAKMVELHDRLTFWDQDVLNSVVNDRFEELNPYLNFNMMLAPENNNIALDKEEEGKMIFLHYTGSFKPWTVRGAFNKKSIYYQDAYFKFYGVKYFIVNTWRVSALTQLLKGIFNLQIKNLRYPFSFILLTIKSLRDPVIVRD